MALSQMAAGAVSGRRNAEAMLVLLSAGFLALAWRALEAAGFDFPTGSGRILTQFLFVAGLGHVALRIVAPRAAPVPYAAAIMLTAVGLAFVTRLSPPSAQAQANWAVVGVALMAGGALAARRFDELRRWKYSAAVLAVVVLIATGLFGETRGGARLWVTIAGQTVQTTEIIKLFVVVFLAGYLADEGPCSHCRGCGSAGGRTRPCPTSHRSC
ncbi:MAG: FtsW/RodA/SpoVE family cell cycle protein [Thermoflexaceae bacterium]|nr:FtsW/RodA/SpoVE family cell cycle protein [Thermoflexaceae bacterium]